MKKELQPLYQRYQECQEEFRKIRNKHRELREEFHEACLKLSAEESGRDLSRLSLITIGNKICLSSPSEICVADYSEDKCIHCKKVLFEEDYEKNSY